MFTVTYDIPANEQDKQVDWKEYSCRCGEGSPESGHEIPDKGGSYDNRPRRYYPYRNGIKELTFGKPMVIKNYSLVQKWDNCKTTTEGKCPRLDEKPTNFKRSGVVADTPAKETNIAGIIFSCFVQLLGGL